MMHGLLKNWPLRQSNPKQILTNLQQIALGTQVFFKFFFLVFLSSSSGKMYTTADNIKAKHCLTHRTARALHCILIQTKLSCHLIHSFNAWILQNTHLMHEFYRAFILRSHFSTHSQFRKNVSKASTVITVHRSIVGFDLNFLDDLSPALTLKWLPWIENMCPLNSSAKTQFILGTPVKTVHFGYICKYISFWAHL